ncbi:serine protease [Salipaludibacillus sp. CF4.18]|uniref:serine protease n=1 Tax=Salipaludibacillus sp. CF4.18 TaxID=3373081 RepID=UPI003EE672DA
MQAKVQKIEEEIKQSKTQLAFLESSLKDIQENCNHEYKNGPLYKECVQCNKVEVLYY